MTAPREREDWFAGTPVVQVARSDESAQPWVLALDATTSSAEARSAIVAGLRRARSERLGWLVLHTCRRVEIIGAGSRPSLTALAAVTRCEEVASMTVHAGESATRRLARLAAGLESTVVGEDQVLGQVRQLRASAMAADGVDARIVRALDLAISTGRRARADRPRAERSLAERGLAWLELQRGLTGSRLLVVGTGPIGTEAARIGRGAGAIVSVASRRPARRSPAGSGLLTFDQAAAAIADTDHVVVALAGPWTELLDVGSGTGTRPPFVVDLSAPPAVPGPIRAVLGRHLATLDDLAAGDDHESAVVAEYRRHAEQLVEHAVERWRSIAVSEAGATIAAIRAVAESRRAASIERLWRRLPELDLRQRDIVELTCRQLVAAILHEPSARLRDNPDARRVGAARDLFGL